MTFGHAMPPFRVPPAHRQPRRRRQDEYQGVAYSLVLRTVFVSTEPEDALEKRLRRTFGREGELARTVRLDLGKQRLGVVAVRREFAVGA